MPRIPPAGRCPGAEYVGTRSSSQPGLVELFLAFAKMSLAGFGGVLVGARRGVVAPLDAGPVEQFNKAFALCHFLPQTEHRQFVRGVRFALWWHCRRCRVAREPFGFRWRYLTKIARQVAGAG
jgi:hypothetical protein